ncbi:hypothetical protein HDU91_007388, partial [Kappamyces sp. JEL0680]
MLSDVGALFVALYASKLAKNRQIGVEWSFGLQRAEVLGALINGISLLALSFTLIIEALQRYVTASEVENPYMVLYVGSAGLVVNLVGLLLFHDHHHHDHQPLPSSENILDPVHTLDDVEHPIQLGEKVIRVAAILHDRHESAESVVLQDLPVSDLPEIHALEKGVRHSHSHDGHSHSHNEEQGSAHGHSHSHHHHDDEHAHGHGHGHSHGDMNMHGVFLHILGDLLASLGVIATSIVLITVKQHWTVYLDPTASLFITCIIVSSTIPLVRSACYILLQRTPSSVSVESLRRDILQIPGVLGVHELHVWQLSEAQTVASVHVVVPRPESSDLLMEERYMQLASAIKIKLHSHGVHSTTVQPEFIGTATEE